jgi:hypothetical protein
MSQRELIDLTRQAGNIFCATKRLLSLHTVDGWDSAAWHG